MNGSNPPVSGDDPFEGLDCSAVVADIWLLLDNECDVEARRRLQSHLDGCPSCFDHYGVQRQLKDLISRKCGNDAAPEGLRERLRVELRRTSITVEQGSVEQTVETTTIRVEAD